ncbi:EscE/YscE/SsaE family type III secretion system needle protein co-chaperone [Microbulbifer sp. ZKSA004]
MDSNLLPFVKTSKNSVLNYLDEQYFNCKNELRLPQAPSTFQALTKRLEALESAQAIVRKLGIDKLSQQAL